MSISQRPQRNLTHVSNCKLFFRSSTFQTSLNFMKVVHIPKCSDEDTTLVTRNENGECLSIPVPKGTGLGIHTPGLHYNREPSLCRVGVWRISPILARYWTNPHQFNPSRFLGDWPRKAFLPFSSGKALGCRLSNTTIIQFTQGPRACLGRKSVISGRTRLTLTYLTWFKGSPKQRS